MTGRAVEATEGKGGRSRLMTGLALIAMLGMAMVFAFQASGTSEAASAKQKALAKCKKIKKAPARKACTNQTKQRFLAPVVVDVRDDYFAPDVLSIRSGRRITWDWGTSNGNAHNFMLDPLATQPKRLTKTDYFRLDSGQSYAINKKITRDLTKTGEYNFYCSLHSTVMKLKVKVKP